MNNRKDQISDFKKTIVETADKSSSLDHAVVLAVINDLVRMQNIVDNMDETIKGVSQLRNRIKSAFNTLASYRYEIPCLLGKSYHSGDNLIGTMELNEELESGTNRIKRVIKPQVSFQGKMIQAGEVVIEYND